ncbi:unnamed protein product, partial [Hapterophycus canaliculatus]
LPRLPGGKNAESLQRWSCRRVPRMAETFVPQQGRKLNLRVLLCSIRTRRAVHTTVLRERSGWLPHWLHLYRLNGTRVVGIAISCKRGNVSCISTSESEASWCFRQNETIFP